VLVCNYHLDELSVREGRWIEFVRSVDIMSGGALVSHDCCAMVFCGRVRVLMKRSQDYDFKTLNESTKYNG